MPRESAEAKLIRMTRIERELWTQGFAVAGIDEVGRGPLAGPVVSGCVSMREDMLVPGVDDSKKLSEAKREALYRQIMDRAGYVRTAFLPAETVDEMGILHATRRTMELAAEDLQGAHFLIDAVEHLNLPGTQRAFIKGDANCYMIAAASIVAKVDRDRYMAALHERYPVYNFQSNKGYGTAEHIAALKAHGPCPEHRRSFIGRILEGTPFAHPQSRSHGAQ